MADRAKLRQAMMAGVLALSLAACSPVYINHGYVPVEEDLAQISVGKTSRDEVQALLGRPASHGVLEGSGLYYVGSRWVRRGALAPKEIDRQVVAISFDAGGRVANIERFGLENGKVVVLSQRVTDSGIKGVSAVRQILSGFGKLSANQVTDM